MGTQEKIIIVYNYIKELVHAYLACVGSLESTRGLRVARGTAESSSSFLSALQTFQFIHNSIYAQLKA